jgi:hypothetical protein
MRRQQQRKLTAQLAQCMYEKSRQQRRPRLNRSTRHRCVSCAKLNDRATTMSMIRSNAMMLLVVAMAALDAPPVLPAQPRRVGVRLLATFHRLQICKGEKTKKKKKKRK